jgi:hypothetical protein
MTVPEALLLAVTTLVLVVVPSFVTAGSTKQLQGCNDVDQPSLAKSDAAYPDAMDLAQTLISHSFIVTCVSPSQMTDTFEGQEGAAVYRTNEGDFEALFLPKPQNFNQLRVIERHDGHSYRYSFAGRPEPWPANLIEGAFPLYFVKHRNELIVAQDHQAAIRIKGAIGGR